jgi:protein CpxP
MKKLLLVCCIVIGISAASHAQGGGRRSPADQAAALKTSLALTDDQTAKVTAIYTAQAKSRDSLVAAGGDMRAAMMPMMNATNAKIKAVLTADQAAKFQAQLDERMKRMQQGGGMGGGGGTPPPPQR